MGVNYIFKKINTLNIFFFLLFSVDKRGSNVLREVEIQVLDNHICHGAYYPTYKIPIKGWHLCAGELEGGKGTCQVGYTLQFFIMV